VSGQTLPFQTKRPSKLNQQHLEHLKYLLNRGNGCLYTLKELKNHLLYNFPEIGDISLKTISNYLKKKLDFTFKRLSATVDRRNFPTTKILQKKVSKELITALSQEYKVIFVDETGFKLNSYPSYGWGKKGEKVSVNVQVNKENFSLMFAITDQEILGCQIITECGAKKRRFSGILKHHF